MEKKLCWHNGNLLFMYGSPCAFFGENNSFIWLFSCVCVPESVFIAWKMKKEFPGQVFREHLVPPLQLLCAVFIDQAIVQIQMNAII